MVVVPASGSVPSQEAAEARALLSGLMTTAYGSAADAHAALDRALHRTNRKELPASIPELLTFLRAGLLPVLSDDLGPRLAIAVLDDFVAKHEERSGIRKKDLPPAPASAPAPMPLGRIAVRPRKSAPAKAAHRTRVLLVDSDRIGRAGLARALLREGFEVATVGSLEELGEIVRSGDELDVVVLDDRHPGRLLVMETVVDGIPGASLVVRSAEEGATRSLLGALGVSEVEVVACSASSEAVVAVVVKTALGRGQR
jgi:CheY-like chemotaxis protein